MPASTARWNKPAFGVDARSCCLLHQQLKIGGGRDGTFHSYFSSLQFVVAVIIIPFWSLNISVRPEPSFLKTNQVLYAG